MDALLLGREVLGILTMFQPERGKEASCKFQVMAQVIQQLLLSGYGRAVDLARGVGVGSSPGLLTPVGVCLMTSDHIRECLSCAVFVDLSIGCHLHRSCSPYAHCFVKHQSSSLELTTAMGQSRYPLVKLRVVTAEGGQVLDLLLSWRSTCSFIFLVVPMAPEMSGGQLGWAGTWACCWEVTGALSPRGGWWDRGQSVCT